MNFSKYEACGNDFIVVNRPFDPQTISKSRVEALCRQHTGIGADGLFFIWQKDARWMWKFFNKDGSVAKFCGNAARCAILWLREHSDPQKREWTWSDGEGELSGRLLKDNLVEVSWPRSRIEVLEMKGHHQSMIKELEDLGLESSPWISAGVPHLVLIGSSWPRKIRKLFYANHLSHHADFIKESNLTWLSRTDMSTVSFERGVEDETLSCGSGALAAYQALKIRSQEDKNLKVPSKVRFEFPGGPLTVEESSDILLLSGPARKVFEGYLEES